MSILAPISIIGAAASGTYFSFGTGDDGGVMTRLGVWAGPSSLRGIRVWLSSRDSPTLFGTMAGTYKEYTFQSGERMTRLSLWGNGAGTRSGAVEFYTSTGSRFQHQMTSWGLKQEYPIDVASGICVGVRGRHGADIDALGFAFLRPIAHAQMINVRYPTLDFEAAGIQPINIRDIRDENHSYNLEKDWGNSGSYTTTNASSWSVTTGLEYHLSVSVTGSIPMVAETSVSAGWSLSVSGTYTQSSEESETTSWDRSGVLPPRSWHTFLVTTRRGRISLPYEASMQVTLQNGARFTYSLRGLYTGVNYSRIDIVTRSGSLDDDAVATQIGGPEAARFVVNERAVIVQVDAVQPKRLTTVADPLWPLASATLHVTSGLGHHNNSGKRLKTSTGRRAADHDDDQVVLVQEDDQPSHAGDQPAPSPTDEPSGTINELHIDNN